MAEFLKKQTKAIDRHFCQFASSIAIIIFGVCLLIDRSYFFWPPSLSALEDDQGVDWFIIFLGIGLLICTLTDNHSRGWTYFFLIFGGAMILMIGGIQVLHVIYADQPEMGFASIGAFLVFALLLRATYKS